MVAIAQALLIAALGITSTMGSDVVCKNGSLIASTGKCCYGVAAKSYCCVKDLTSSTCLGICSSDGSDCLAKVKYDDPDFDKKVKAALDQSKNSSTVDPSTSTESPPSASSAKTPAVTTTATGFKAVSASASVSGSGKELVESTSISEGGSVRTGVPIADMMAGLAALPVLMNAL